MWWRLGRSEFNQQKGEGNKKALKKIVDAGETPGIIAYAEGEPIGWCSFGPREVFPTLEHSRLLKRVDNKKVWSVVCFFIAKQFRHRGVTLELLESIIEHVRRQGCKIVEGYPTEPKTGKTPDVFAYTGLASAFRKAGFTEVARRSDSRPIVRYMITER
jgi:GNAT superfamily N-acetyltransferase